MSDHEPILTERTMGERMAYLQGFEAGMNAALDEVRRLNFTEVAAKAEGHVGPILKAVTHFSMEIPGDG